MEFDNLLSALALLVGDDVDDVVELLRVGNDGLRLDIVHEFLELVHDLVLELQKLLQLLVYVIHSAGAVRARRDRNDGTLILGLLFGYGFLCLREGRIELCDWLLRSGLLFECGLVYVDGLLPLLLAFSDVLHRYVRERL